MFKISIVSFVIVLSSCGMKKLTPSEISTVRINTNINPTEINDNNKITVKNLKGESRSFKTPTFSYNSFDDYNFIKNQFSKKRRTLVISHPYYNPDTIVIGRKLRPVIFSLDLLGAITLYLSPSLIIDLANGNIWKVKKSDKTQNLQFSHNDVYYKTQLAYANEKQTIDSVNNFLNSYNDSIIKIKENGVIEKKIELINMLISSSLSAIKQISSNNNLNSLAEALLIYNESKSSFYSYLGVFHKFESEEYKKLYELNRDGFYKSGFLLKPHYIKDVIQEINDEFYDLQNICSKISDENYFLNKIHQINDKKFISLILINLCFKNFGYNTFDFDEFEKYKRTSLENYFPNVSRKEYISKLNKNVVFKYVWNEQIQKTWKEFYIEIFEDWKKIKEKGLTNYFVYSNGQFYKAAKIDLEQHFLFNTIYKYNIFQNLIEKNELVTSQIQGNNSQSYFDTRQEINFEKNEINWEYIIKNDKKLSSKNIKGPIEFGSEYFPEISTMEGLTKYNMNNWIGSVFFVKDNKAGFYKSEGCNGQSDGYCGINALKPLQLLNNDLYVINIFKPKYIFKNDTIVLTMKLKDKNNGIRYFHKYYQIKRLIDNPLFIYPSGKENESAKESIEDILMSQRDGKLNAVQTELLLNKIDFGNYNPGTIELSKIFIDVNFLFQDYDIKDYNDNNIVREFDKLNPFDPKQNLLGNCNENTSEYNQFQLLFGYNSDNLFSNLKNKEKNYLGIFGGDK